MHAMMPVLFMCLCVFVFPTDVKGELDDLLKTRKNFDARVGFTEDLEQISVCFEKKFLTKNSA